MTTTMSETSQKMQYVGTFTMLLLMLANGSANGWNSPSFTELLSSESPLASGPLSLNEASWISSNICIGSVVGAPLMGWVNERIGRKPTAYLGSLIQMIAWLFIAMAQSHHYLYISRFLVGFGAMAVYVAGPIYISEISETKVRGFLGSLFYLFSNLGVFLAFSAGAFLPSLLTPWCFIPLNILFFVGFLKLPESPLYLAKKGDLEAAERSLRFYRGVGDAKTAVPASFAEELADLKAISAETPLVEMNKETETGPVLNMRVVRKAMLISMVLCVLQQMNGGFPMLQYTEMIFAKAGSSMSPKTAAIVVALIQVIGSYFSTLLIERAGRKVLLLVSSVGAGFGLSIFGTYFLLDDLKVDVSGFSWLPLAVFSFVIFIVNCGLLNLPFLVLAEILPTEVKSFGTSMGNLVLNVASFVLLKFLPQVMEEIGMFAALYVFALCCFLGALFVLCVMPETKGKSFSEISAALEK